MTRTFDVRPDEWLVGLIDTHAERVYEAGDTPPAKLHVDYHHDERGLLDEVKIEPDSTDPDVRETISFQLDDAGRLRGMRSRQSWPKHGIRLQPWSAHILHRLGGR